MTADAPDPSSPAPDDTIAAPPRVRRAATDAELQEDTILSPRRAARRAAALAAAGAPQAEQPSAAVAVRLPDGGLLALDRPLLIGRRPRLPRVPVAPLPQLVALPSPRRELSATHLELRPQGAAVVVTDLRSTNGTVVIVPGAAPRTLVPGETAVVPVGSIVDLGDGNALALLPAAPGGVEA